jgi:hypothetical protein
MITINVRAIVCYSLLFFIAWFGRPVWFQLAALLIDLPTVRAGLIGFALGMALRASWAWNAALAHRRQQAIDKAEREYTQDRRKVIR